MAPKIFLTGTTGYIGGDSLYLISQKHSEWELTCLVRNSDKGAKIATVYPRVRLVYGDLDAVDLIEEEAANTDIVYHFANCDHEPSARAIAKGLARRNRDGPGFWIHTSGTLILGWETIDLADFGNKLDKVYDDWDNVGELISQPDHAAHRNVDKIVLAASSDKVKTAIVCPPTIWGRGRGPDNTRSAQLYMATASFLKHQKAFKVGKGENIWHEVHVCDLSNLYLLIGEAAVNGGSPATWNDLGYYLAENGPFVWGDVLQEIANVAHKKGLLPDATVESLSPMEAERLFPHARLMIGTNSRGMSIRGKKLLGWRPTMHGIMDEIPECVEGEAQLLGLIKRHAAKVAE
ncbi:Semialdehyde dehydrogenase, NAD binding domain-containing protein isoform 2 [Cladophialophora immunda]|nr:Semialdehyde dehydrogenase, NAD binding domain-containing protein isoform 1 [Cladophialophora immunda]OQU97262.1 Semialdehyde dehydrogenase, NAD binding domain-containing protein isoform 2 [Cladophialophora immunda]